MDEMDMLLPELPVLGNDSSGGSSRLVRGNVLGGPTETGGGRGCGKL